MQLAELDRPISDILPHIFKRPALSVGQQDTLLQVATFLALGPQIYVDGLVVLDGKKPVGAIGGQHIIRYILEHQEKWSLTYASEIMNRSTPALEAGEPLSKALQLFAKTRFAFVPITSDGLVVTSLSLRDVLRVVTDLHLDTPISRLASQLVAVEGGSIGKVLELMLVNGIRNVGLRSRTADKKSRIRIINDRKIMEFFLSHKGREAMMAHGPQGLSSMQLDILDIPPARHVSSELPAADAAELLSDIATPCLLLSDELIVTPWDIVMKGLGQI